MTRKRRFLLPAAALGIAVIAVGGYLALRRGGGTDLARLRGGRDLNVILVTLDTTRADRLGCYGFRNIETPTLDLFASRGVRFERCYAQTPLTLPSHTTLMTGTLPLFHGVRDNGGFVVPAPLVTMAELFKERGYATGAFIAAYVLDSKWGLDQGFDTYFDKFDLGKFKHISLGTVQRPANEVMAEALPWLERNRGGKFFAWIHLYDAHSPYEPPPPYDKLYPHHPYLGEIAFVDSQLRRLWELVTANGLERNTVIVVAGDHGESLGEHAEQAHGFFIYQGAIHVPLIFVTPYAGLRGKVASEVAGLSDVLPTICEIAGFPVPPQVQGHSLAPAFAGRRREAPGPAYSETYYPRFHYGWSDLKAVQDERYKLILAPVPELYDVVADPREEKNLVYLDKPAYARLSAEAEAFIRKSGENAYETDLSKVDEETREKLSALGYVGSFTDPSKLAGKRLADPKDKIVVFNELSRARELGMNGKPDEGIGIIRKIIASDPDVTDAYFTLGNIYFQTQKYRQAIDHFKQVLGRKPDDTFAAINITLAYEGMGAFADAEKFLLEYMAKGVVDPQFYFMLGNMSFLQKRYDKAVPYFEKCISLNAESAGAHNMLAAIAILRRDAASAERHIGEALRINPKLANAHYNQAQVFEEQGRPREAEAEYLRELQITPKHFKAMYNLSRLYREAGDEGREYEYLKACLDTDPGFPLTYFYLARIYLNRGERYGEAVDLVQKGIVLKPEASELPLGYFLLADLYSRLGNGALSEEYARKGQAAAASRAR
jgi:arylsulfatase A-like enzyme/Tfp pilus assembly protein PilF